ncbi:acVLRF1 family peptidyl-tRNA hydrolase [Pseudokineococcus sp. 1T1Z-3]|uniref:acVLRF1 family peptidyl-tRNA hydrolase n=1 Tax=Pseudokineococcus sp. 1T1Z-3 TaxID=3132745 RepID=UPI0030A2F881
MGRVPGWLQRFAASHGGVTVVAGAGGAVHLAAPDGTQAFWRCPGRDLAGGAPAGSPLQAEDVLDRLLLPRVALVLLLRRGGAVAGVVAVDRDGSQVLDARVRVARVQARTAAGGWSQQRFARRRAGQAAGLVRDAAASAATVWAPHTGRADLLAVGGDRELCAAALAALPASVAGAANLVRQDLALTADPRRRVLDDLARDVGGLHVRVQDPPRG